MTGGHPSSLFIQNRGNAERGQSVIEFAILAPLLVFIVLGLMEVGNGLNSYLTVVAASRDAARMGAQGNVTEAQMLTVIEKETEETLPSTLPTSSENCGSGAGVCISETTVASMSGSMSAIEVRVCYDHPMLLGSPLFIGPIQMCSKTTMRVADGN